jgi:branched-chain amino acid transport system ATP-binding protein
MKLEKSNSQEIIALENLELHFGGVNVLNNVSFKIYEREILALIGPNGAGKTSIINSISGFYKPQQGQILYKNETITKKNSLQRSKMGIARTFQNIELYNGLSVLDNLMAGGHNHMTYGAIAAGIYFGKARRQESKFRVKIEEIIELLELESVRSSTVGALPYGVRKRIDLGRALATMPKLLLLDEPMAGMNSEEKEDMARFILDINELYNITILLIEHDMGVVMDISDRIVVLDFGKKLAEGLPDEVRNNSEVIKAYLGSDE